ncbi:hypothetical protein L9F63_022403, partial [Diploptera punctata]
INPFNSYDVTFTHALVTFMSSARAHIFCNNFQTTPSTSNVFLREGKLDDLLFFRVCGDDRDRILSLLESFVLETLDRTLTGKLRRITRQHIRPSEYLSPRSYWRQFSCHPTITWDQFLNKVDKKHFENEVLECLVRSNFRANDLLQSSMITKNKKKFENTAVKHLRKSKMVKCKSQQGSS